MIPRIKHIEAGENLTLFVTFDDDIRVLYDVNEDIKTIKEFLPLRTQRGLFKNFQLDQSRTCVTWSDRIDLPSDTIFEYGKRINTQ